MSVMQKLWSDPVFLKAIEKMPASAPSSAPTPSADAKAEAQEASESRPHEEHHEHHEAVFFDPANRVTRGAGLQEVAKWIFASTPDFVGPIPAEWTDGVIGELRRQGVADRVIGPAMKFAQKNGYAFTVTTKLMQLSMLDNSLSVDLTPPAPGDDAPRMNPAEPMTPEEAGRVAAIYERRYQEALLNHDESTILSVVGAVRIWIRNLIAAIMIARDARRITEMERTRSQILLNAPNVTRLAAGGEGDEEEDDEETPD